MTPLTYPAARLSIRRTTAWTALVLGACLLLLAAPGATRLSAQPAGQPASDRPVLLLDIKGAIGVVSAEQLAKALQRAAAAGAQALVVRLDTPGGLLSSTREMILAILASPVPVVMYVAPNGSRAASAGTYLMYASHVAAMAPSTHLGAATPISLSPGGLPGSPPPPQPDPAKDGKDKERARRRQDRRRAQGHQRRGGLHPLPRRAAGPQRRLGRAGGARGRHPHRLRRPQGARHRSDR